MMWRRELEVWDSFEKIVYVPLKYKKKNDEIQNLMLLGLS